MNKREIKFRVWDKQNNKMLPHVYKMGSGFPSPIYCYDLMQYTGLRDKNNKEIYEGDLLISDGIVYKANWKGCLYGTSRMGYPLACDNPQTIRDEFEIIGNIYETPHLIKNQTA